MLFVGTGVSGGEEGARFGPSMMPGGSPAAWPLVKDIFQAICAKTPDGEPCCDWMGEDGAGHYVKMVHNGIEYGDMQLICEAYQLMKEGLGMSNEEMHDVFAEWNKGELDSYLIEITRDILAYKDEKGEYVVDKILDTAGQKGTGKWTSVSSLDLGMPVTLIGEAVYARCLSAMKDERVAASKILNGPEVQVRRRQEGVRRGYPAGAAGLQDRLLRAGLHAAARGGQGIPLEPELRRHRAWCGAPAASSARAFLGKIKEAFDRNPNLSNLLLDRVLHGRDRALPGILAARGGARPWRPACPCRRSPPRSRSTTATAASACRPTCCRRSATTSAPTPTSASISRAASSSTPTGPARAATSRPGTYTVMSADVTQLASKIRLLLMDVDGVLTDGKLYNVPGPDGKMAETKGFDSQDGIALQWLARARHRHRA